MKIVLAEEIESRVVQEVCKKIRISEVIMNIYELNKIEKKLSQNDIKALIDNVVDVWNALHLQEQRKIVRLLIARIDLHESHMDLEINLDGFIDYYWSLTKMVENTNEEIAEEKLMQRYAYRSSYLIGASTSRVSASRQSVMRNYVWAWSSSWKSQIVGE